MHGRRKSLKPEMPSYVKYVYTASFLLSLVFSYMENPILHGVFCVTPIWMLLYILKNRLVRGDLASVLVTLSLLAEAFAHLFHQFEFDKNLFVIYFIEHLCCAIFLAMAFAFYFVQRRFPKKHDKFKNYLPKFFFVLPCTYGGAQILEFLIVQEEQNWILYIARSLYIIPVTVLLVFSFWRFKTTCFTSFIFGFMGAILYDASDLLNGLETYQKIETTFLTTNLIKALHRFGLLFIVYSSLHHMKWLERKRFKLE